MSRGDSASRIMGAPKSRRGVRFPENCYAPTAHGCIVTDHGYHRTLTASVRVGTGKDEVGEGRICRRGSHRRRMDEYSEKMAGCLLL